MAEIIGYPLSMGACEIIGRCTDPEGLGFLKITECLDWKEHLADQGDVIEKTVAMCGCPALAERSLRNSGVEFIPFREETINATP